MTVKELINILEKCNPDAVVCAETCVGNEVFKVAEYTKEEQDIVYIGDDFCYVDDTLVHEMKYNKKEVK